MVCIETCMDIFYQKLLVLVVETTRRGRIVSDGGSSITSGKKS